MKSKEYLNQLRIWDMRIERNLEKIEKANQMATRSTSYISDMPRSPQRDNQAHEKLLVKLIDMEYDTNKMIDQYVDLKTEIEVKLYRLSRTEYIDILYYRYFENMSYKDISFEMHISRSYAYKLHERALIEFDSILEDDDA